MGTCWNCLGEAVLTCTKIYVLNESYEKLKILPMKISIFASDKNLLILHGQVFVINVFGESTET